MSLPEFFSFDTPGETTDAFEQLRNIIATVPPEKAGRFTELVGKLVSLLQD